MRQIPKSVKHLGIINPFVTDNTSDNLSNIIVYRHQCLKPGPYFEQNYVGVTVDEVTRRRKWNQMTNKNYGGKKVTEARDFANDKTDWSYEVHERISYVGTWEEIISYCDQLETKYIAYFDSYEHGLNGNKGGSGMCSDGFTPELRAKIGATSKGRKFSAESIAKRVAKTKGKKRTPEQRANISKGTKGKKRTPEQKAVQSARMKGKNPVAATEAAKKWHKDNPGGWWGNHTFPPESVEKRKAVVREKAQRIKVTNSKNETTCYLCQTDAAKATGVADGSIKYAIDHTNGIHAKSGYQFERISDEEYQEWKRQNRA